VRRALSETRKIAAILVSDVVGYSRLAGADEDRILARLRTLRSDLIDPLISVHHGRIVKRTGDGSIIEFRSVVDAVRLAIEVQSAMVERNAEVPEDRRILFRIGIHLGDVVEERDGDLMGDGVNIAARLEGVAKPGGICISEQAYWQVKGRRDLEVTDLGATQLKNIAEPIRVYALDVGKLAQEQPTSAKPISASQRPPWRAMLAIALVALLLLAAALVWEILSTRRPPIDQSAQQPDLSIVVLPFTNLSGDASQDYLGDVLTEELTTSLARLPHSFVVSRTTAFAYRGRAEDVKAIGKELGVRYVLEGSAQKSEGRIRVDAQLIDAASGAHLWADQFDAKQAELLEMQDEIVTRLARALQIQLAAVEASRVSHVRPENADAEDLAMQCEAGYLRSGAQRAGQPTYTLCERALEMDADNVRVLAILAIRSMAHVINFVSENPEPDLRRADNLTARALTVDPNNYLAHYARSLFLAFARPDEAIAEGERALALNPSFLPTYNALSAANLSAGQPQKAIEYAETALRLSPHDPLAYAFLRDKGLALFSLARYEEAADAFRESAAVNPDLAISFAMLAASVAMRGQDADAHLILERYLAVPAASAKSVPQIKSRQPYDNPFLHEVYSRVYEGLRKAGLPEE
jgi:adenylate cyclase